MAAKKSKVPSRKARSGKTPSAGKKNPAGKRTGKSSVTAIRNTLKKAAAVYFERNFGEAIAYLDSLAEILDNAPDTERLDYYRLLTFSYANSGRSADAEKAALKGLELDSDDPDFHFGLAYVFTGFKDYKRSLEHSIKFVKLLARMKKGKDGIRYLSEGHEHLIFNYLGLAYKASNEFEKAEVAFRRVIELNPAYEHAYLNLANLYQHRNDYMQAEKIVDLGLKQSSQVQELRLIKKSLENRATICACLIVKNEEELLPNCLDSIRSWVDDLIIVDTGSTDRTVEIAHQYGAKVFFKEWEGSFSAARNFSISKATCDWILYIDADEEFVQEDVGRLRQAMALENCRLISVDIYNIKKETGECTSILSYPRIFRSDAGFQFEGIVHNQLKYDESEVIVQAGIRLKHYGYNLAPDKMKQKIARSTALLEKQLQDFPDDPFVHFNYAQILRSSTNEPDESLCNKILKHARIAVDLSNTHEHHSPGVRLQALHQQATTLLRMGQFEESKNICLRALELKPNYLDALFTLAEAYAKLSDLDRAEEYFLKYLHEQEVYDPAKEQISMIQLYAMARHKVYYWLGTITNFRQEFKSAEEYFLKCLDELEPYSDTYLKLAAIYLDRRELEKANDYIDRELNRNPESDMANLYKARYFGLKNLNAKAEHYLSKAVDLTRDNPEILERAGVYWAGSNNYDRAIPILERLLDLRPGYEHGCSLLARVHYDRGNFETAYEWYKKYTQMAPDNAEAINDMAGCAFKLGRFEEAEELFGRSLELNSNIAATYRNIGLTKLCLGKLKEARTYLENYNKIAPDDLDVVMALGIIDFQEGAFGAAIPHFEKFLGRNPKNIDCLFNISECYLNLGYADSAAIGYRQILKIRPDFEPAARRLNEMETAKAPA
nr:tetratricopeptide repeat protein [candidate division Zixibacteria bacterium]